MKAIMKRVTIFAIGLVITTGLSAQNPYEVFGRSLVTDPELVQASSFVLTNIDTLHPVQKIIVNQREKEVILITRHGDTLLAHGLTPEIRLRWLSVDPFYYNHSPYLGMGNNPVSAFDPSGGVPYYLNKETGAVFWSAENVSEMTIDGLVYQNIGSYWARAVGENMLFYFENELVGVTPFMTASNLPVPSMGINNTHPLEGLSLVSDALPVISTITALWSVGVGTDMFTGEKLSWWQIGLAALPFVTRMRTPNSGTNLSTNGAKLSEHLSQLEKYGTGGYKELANGRYRYYGQAKLNIGDANSFRMVREWNPATGGKRTWFETLNPNGGVIQVRPELGSGIKTHYLFNGSGGYLGKW